MEGLGWCKLMKNSLLLQISGRDRLLNCPIRWRCKNVFILRVVHWNKNLQRRPQETNPDNLCVMPLGYKDENTDLWDMFVLKTLADLPRLVPVSCCQEVWWSLETLWQVNYLCACFTSCSPLLSSGKTVEYLDVLILRWSSCSSCSARKTAGYKHGGFLFTHCLGIPQKLFKSISVMLCIIAQLFFLSKL